MNNTTSNIEEDLTSLINKAIFSHLVEMFTCLPCKVRNVSPNLVDVEVTLKRKVNDKIQNYSVINNVPILQTGVSETKYLRFPLKKNDPGLLVFSQRSLEKWIDSDGSTIIDPDDDRLFDISDAVFLPGMLPKKKKINIDDDIELRNTLSKLVMSPDGTFEITGKTGGLLNTISGTLSDQITANTALIAAFTAWGTSFPIYATYTGAIVAAYQTHNTQLAASKFIIDGMKK